MITEDQFKTFNSNSDTIPYIYGLPKIHKPSVPLRHIIAYHLSPAIQLSRHLRLSNIAAELVMSAIDSWILEQKHLRIEVWKRYLDDIFCISAPNTEYKLLILYPWIRSPYRVLSARPAEPSRGSGCVMGFPHWDSKETEADLDGNSKKVEVDHGRSQSDHGRHGCRTSRIGAMIIMGSRVDKAPARVVNGIGKKREAESNRQKFQVDRPRPVRTPATVSKVKRLATTENPPSQRQLSRMCVTSLKTINNIIHKDLELDTRRKGKVHKLTPFHMKNRATNARKLYEEHLAGSRSEYTATLDEAWMYVTYCNGIRKICYIKRGNQVPDNWVHQCSETFPKGFMVVGVMTGRGVLPLIKVPSKVKVNSEFYIECVLKPVIEQLKDLYPGEMDKVLLHHDKASSHTSNKTQQFLQEMKDTLGLNFIRNSDIPVKSPDASPLDFYGFGMLKQRLFNRRSKTEAGLWKAAQEEWSNVSLSKVKEVFAAWKNASAFVIKTGSTTQWQADLAPKEMVASDTRNRRHVQMLLTWSTNAAHPVSLDQEPIQGTISRANLAQQQSGFRPTSEDDSRRVESHHGAPPPSYPLYTADMSKNLLTQKMDLTASPFQADSKHTDRSLRNCNNCHNTQLTPDHIYPALLAALYIADINPEEDIHTDKEPRLAVHVVQAMIIMQFDFALTNARAPFVQSHHSFPQSGQVDVMAGVTHLKTKMVFVDCSLRHTGYFHCLGMETDVEQTGLQIQGHFAEKERGE
ncbi:IKK1 [Cordylochernes scorpioides]|uniref:IKK1 n=1 Tax=Cordylochernes scorpioides TaxID=51811 RepID=A0ABY6KUA8_9ARAC|nr:IKK1 [Cordylochernes scorpioides]